MVYEIKKNDRGDVELLPDIIETPLWEKISPESVCHPKRSDRLISFLYDAIQKRENYFQENTPTAFGNPEHEHRCGVVVGLLLAMEAVEHRENGQIVIRKGRDGRKLLVVDVPTRPEWYYESVRDNRETLEALGF